MLWYEELLLLFLQAPAGDFKISGAGIEIGDALGQREPAPWLVVEHCEVTFAGRRRKL